MSGDMMPLPPWHAEIVELHEFFQGWLDGTLPPTDAAFARLVDSTGAQFTLISPSGELATREALLRDLRAAHGSRPGWRMWIERAQLRCQRGGLAVATYEEWQQDAAGTTARISTAVLAEQAGAPNGLAWLHVHETWLPHGSVEEDTYEATDR